MSTLRGTRIMVYFTKGTGPTDRRVAWGLVRLAYEAVKHLDFDAKEILLRGEMHNTTRQGGKTVIDPLGYHLTMSFRTEKNFKDDTFMSAHAYTKGKNDFDLTQAKIAANPLPMDAKDIANKLIWPIDPSKEDVFYVDPSGLGPKPAGEGLVIGSGELATGIEGNVPSTAAHTPSTGQSTGYVTGKN